MADINIDTAPWEASRASLTETEIVATLLTQQQLLISVCTSFGCHQQQKRLHILFTNYRVNHEWKSNVIFTNWRGRFQEN